MNDYKFGNFLCYLRESKNLTQIQIAKELNVTVSAVSKWENGESKPRIETLFKLANILGVRAEELVAGEYLIESTLSQDKINDIYKKYEYLQKVESYSTASVKLRRCAAWIIDWNLSFLFAFIPLLIFLFILAFVNEKPPAEFLAMITILIIQISAISFFILRDLMFKGKGIGKRILGLVILDAESGEKAKWHQYIIRNLFFFLPFFSLIYMLVSGLSIGDKVAHTIIVSKKSLSKNYSNTYNLNETFSNNSSIEN